MKAIENLAHLFSYKFKNKCVDNGSKTWNLRTLTVRLVKVYYQNL